MGGGSVPSPFYSIEIKPSVKVGRVVRFPDTVFETTESEKLPLRRIQVLEKHDGNA
jgi:hypothetical protein